MTWLSAKSGRKFSGTAERVNQTVGAEPSESASGTASRVSDGWLVFLGAWLLSGVYLDGWAHTHIEVETFFSPWHAILYSGYLANLIFWGRRLIDARRKGRTWREAVPEPYRLAFFGVLLFTLGGMGDMLWHLIIGIEESVSAGFSPPHLAIMVAIGLIVSGAYMGAWHRDASPARPGEWLPLLLSLTLTLSLATFLTQYGSPLVSVAAAAKPLKTHHEALGAVAILLHAIILMGAILITILRWQLPLGSLTLVLTLNVAAMSIMRERFFLIPAIALAGVGADFLLWKLRPGLSRPRQFHLFAFLVPLIYFYLYFAAVGLVLGITWPAPLWTGAALMASIFSCLLSFLMLPAPYPRSALASPSRQQ